MTIDFIDTIPGDINLKPVLLSGPESAGYAHQAYLALLNDDAIIGLYEIKCQIHCSPFKEALVVENLLAVGYEGYFYLFNLTASQNILQLEMAGYFGHLYYDNEHFYVTDASGLYCIEHNGSIRWKNSGLAIDGVIITEFTDSIISGSGEFDPPEGWIEFSLDRETGKNLI